MLNHQQPNPQPQKSITTHPHSSTQASHPQTSEHILDVQKLKKQARIVTGDTVQDILRAVLWVGWGTVGGRIGFLVGYEISNYVVEVKAQTQKHEKQTQKLIVKLYRQFNRQTIQTIEAQNQVLQYLNNNNSQSKKFQSPIPPLPHPCPNFFLISLNNTNKDGELVYIRVLSYLSGTMLGELLAQPSPSQMSPLISQRIPTQIAQSLTVPLLHLTGSPLCSPKILPCYSSRPIQWHISSFLTIPEYYHLRYQMVKSNPNRQGLGVENIGYFVNRYRRVWGELQEGELRGGLVHHDLNQWNVVVGGGGDIGFIDFGDMVYSWVLEDIAIYCTYMLYIEPTPQKILTLLPKILSTYTKDFPLTVSQLKLVLASIPLRMCISLCNSEYAISQNPNNQYVGMSQKYGWTMLRVWRELLEQQDGADNGFWNKVVEGCTICQINNLEIGKINNLEIGKISNLGMGKISNLGMGKISNLGMGMGILSEQYSQECPQQQFWPEYPNQTCPPFVHISSILSKYYPSLPVMLEVSRMGGYLTKNYMVRMSDNSKYVMKVYRNNPRLQNYSEIVCKICQYLHMQQKNQTTQQAMIYFPVPVLLQQQKQQQKQQEQHHKFNIVRHDPLWQSQVLIRLLRFVEGMSYAQVLKGIIQEVNYSNQNQEEQEEGLQFSQGEMKIIEFVGSMGSMLGKLSSLLQECLPHLVTQSDTPKSLSKYLVPLNNEWNFTNPNTWLQYLPIVPCKSVETLILYFHSLFVENCELGRLRKGLMHMDPTEDNCMVSPQNQPPRVDCIIDFDDLQYTYLICDIVCVLAHCFHLFKKHHQGNVNDKRKTRNINRINELYARCIREVVSRYRQEFPLTNYEIQCLYYFLALRISMCIVLQTRDQEKDPSNTHIAFDLQLLTEYLSNLSLLSSQQFTNSLKTLHSHKTPSLPSPPSPPFCSPLNKGIDQVHALLERMEERGLSEKEMEEVEGEIWEYDWVKAKVECGEIKLTDIGGVGVTVEKVLGDVRQRYGKYWGKM